MPLSPSGSFTSDGIIEYYFVYCKDSGFYHMLSITDKYFSFASLYSVKCVSEDIDILKMTIPVFFNSEKKLHICVFEI